VSDILDYILDKVKLSAEDKKIRLLEVMSYKIQKEYNGTESISAIQDIITLYAEVSLKSSRDDADKII